MPSLQIFKFVILKPVNINIWVTLYSNIVILTCFVGCKLQITNFPPYLTVSIGRFPLGTIWSVVPKHILRSAMLQSKFTIWDNHLLFFSSQKGGSEISTLNYAHCHLNLLIRHKYIMMNIYSQLTLNAIQTSTSHFQVRNVPNPVSRHTAFLDTAFRLPALLHTALQAFSYPLSHWECDEQIVWKIWHSKFYF